MTTQHSTLNKTEARSIQKKNLIWILILAIAASVLSVFFLDQSLVQAVTTKKYSHLYRIVRFLTDLGEGIYYFSAVIVLGALSSILLFYFRKIKKKTHEIVEKLAFWTWYALSCMLASGIVLQILKHIIGRQRPHVTAELNPFVFDIFTLKWHYHSMPSGHSQTVFTFATILWLTFPRIGKWIFIFPAILALTRVPLEEHFLSDVILGACVGVLTTILVSVRWKKANLN